MKYLDEFRASDTTQRLLEEIRRSARSRWTLMDVCGGQTHGLVRHGIEQALSGVVDLIHGPGCPVCVTPGRVIDFAVALAMKPNTLVATFGDMLRVPGTSRSLMQARSEGGQVRMVYSPLDALKIAEQNPQQEVVFLGIGFETTAPSTALLALQARARRLDNLSLIPAHVRVLPAMEAIMEMPDCLVQGFLAAGHVCAITGYEHYQAFAAKYRVPVVVTGFEPIDLLEGIRGAITCLENGKSDVLNRYERSVTSQGNTEALEIVDRVYRIADQPWRGFGVIRDGGLALREEFQSMDAWIRFPDAATDDLPDDPRCRSADVLAGLIKPTACPEFGTTCVPENPLGAPMVSGEGACAAYQRYTTIRTPDGHGK